MRKQQILIILLFSILLSSCLQHKNVLYMRDIGIDSTTVYLSEKGSYKIQSGDILYVKINSIDNNINSIFNAGTGVNNTWQSDLSVYINGYTVSDSGYVFIPIVGKVFVKGETIESAKKNVSTEINKYLKKTDVIVKLISFKYTVLGEVNKQGSYLNYNDRLTILEALGNAGDITDYGNKKRVLVIRPTIDGEKVFRIDLTDKNLLNSEAYYLLPNDVIYVEPVKFKSFRLNSPNISLVLSSVTTLILLLNFLNK